MFLDVDVKQQRRATAFLSGGFLAYILGLTNDYNNIDIYIEYDLKVFDWVQQFMDNTLPGSKSDRKIWIRKKTYHTSGMTQTNDVNKFWDGLLLFKNYGQTWVRIHCVCILNESHPIVQQF